MPEPHLAAIALELSLTCACGAPVALNAVVPRATCDRCGRALDLPAPVWARLLEAPLDEGARMHEDEQRNLPFESPVGLVRRVVRRTTATCLGCAAPIAAEAVLRAACPGWYFCARCNHRASIRALDAIAPGARLVGEDEDQLGGRAMTSTEAIALPCSRCAAPLDLRGGTRNVRCAYCGTTSLVPDDVWARMHPTRPVRRFYAFVAAAVRDEVDDDLPSFENADDGLCDAAGNLYFAFDDEVLSVDPTLRVRWRRTDVRGDRLALVANRLVLYREGAKHLRALDLARGEDAAPFSPPPGLDTLVGDFDGTALGIFGEVGSKRILYRLDANGAQIPLFDEVPQSAGFFSRVASSLSNHVERDLDTSGAAMTPLPGRGVAYLQVFLGEDFYVKGFVVDRAGKTMTTFPASGVPWNSLFRRRLERDAYGRILFFANRSVLVLGPQGTQKLLTTRTDVRGLACAPNGDLWVWGDGLRRFDGQGRIVFVDRSAEEADRRRQAGYDEDDDDAEDDDD
jgi:LSD1 subclass zinc finger protein